MANPHFETVTIPVNLEFKDGNPQLTILENPQIPRATMATISWVATAASEPFEFAGFEWEKKNQAFADPVRLGPGMAALVNNQHEDDISFWPYQLAVTTTAMPGDIIWATGRGTVVKPVAGLRNIIASMRFRIGSLSDLLKPEESSVVSSIESGPASMTASKSSGSPGQPALMTASSGPMIILTRF